MSRQGRNAAGRHLQAVTALDIQAAASDPIQAAIAEAQASALAGAKTLPAGAPQDLHAFRFPSVDESRAILRAAIEQPDLVTREMAFTAMLVGVHELLETQAELTESISILQAR